MKFGFAFANAGPLGDPELASVLGPLAEELGFESLWTVEHVVVPTGYSSPYPYTPDGKMPGGEQVAITDPLIWLAFVAATTTTIRLGTGILILPQRNPLVLAKEVATLDRLSGGRVDLGIGVGWLREEFDALGIPFERRGARTDEYVDVMRRLWREPTTAFSGEFTDFAELNSYPKPAGADGVPIHIGGHSDAAARRAGRIGDGFFPGRGEGNGLEGLLDTMRAAAKEAGRDADAIEITSGGGLDLDSVKRAADLGVDRYTVPPLAFDLEGLRSRLGAFSETVIAKIWVIYRIRTYVAVAENIDTFNALFRDYLLPIQVRHGARLIGRWVSEDAARITAVWEYDDVEAYNRIDAAVRADPDSAVARARADSLGRLYLSREDAFARSTLD